MPLYGTEPRVARVVTSCGGMRSLRGSVGAAAKRRVKVVGREATPGLQSWETETTMDIILTYDPHRQYMPEGQAPIWASLDTVECVARLLDTRIGRDDLKREGLKLLALGLAAAVALLRLLLVRPGSGRTSAASASSDTGGQTNAPLGR
jgi:hypothetical protein